MRRKDGIGTPGSNRTLANRFPCWYDSFEMGIILQMTAVMTEPSYQIMLSIGMPPLADLAKK